MPTLRCHSVLCRWQIFIEIVRLGAWVTECHEIQMPPALRQSEMPGNVTSAPVTRPRVSQCPKVQCQVCLGQGPALSWDALWETIALVQARLNNLLQAISMKPMSNRIVLALVVIWNCNVSMKMPPKIDFFITRKDFALKLNYFHHKQVSYTD